MSTPTRPTILVLGSTGLMGREVVRSLNERGVTPRVLVREPSRLRPTDQVEIHRGDLRDPASLREAMRGVDAVFHISPTRPTRSSSPAPSSTPSSAKAPASSSPASTSTPPTASPGGRCAPSMAGCSRATAARSRSATWSRPPTRARSSSASATSCSATRSSSTSSAAASSSSRPTPRASTASTCATSATSSPTSCSTPTIPAGAYPVVGPRSLTGAECARTWSQALGVPVTYVGDDDAAIDAALDRPPHRLPPRGLEVLVQGPARVRRHGQEVRDRRHHTPPRPPADRLHRVRRTHRRRARTRAGHRNGSGRHTGAKRPKGHCGEAARPPRPDARRRGPARPHGHVRHAPRLPPRPRAVRRSRDRDAARRAGHLGARWPSAGTGSATSSTSTTTPRTRSTGPSSTPQSEPVAPTPTAPRWRR